MSFKDKDPIDESVENPRAWVLDAFSHNSCFLGSMMLFKIIIGMLYFGGFIRILFCIFAYSFSQARLSEGSTRVTLQPEPPPLSLNWRSCRKAIQKLWLKDSGLFPGNKTCRSLKLSGKKLFIWFLNYFNNKFNFVLIQLTFGKQCLFWLNLIYKIHLLLFYDALRN